MKPCPDDSIPACDDPLILAEVERALDPYRKLLTPELLQVFRDELIYGLTEHPVVRDLVSRMRQRAVPDESGEFEKTIPAANRGVRKIESGGKR